MNPRIFLLVVGGLFLGFGIGALGIDAAAFVIASLGIGIAVGVGIGWVIGGLMGWHR